jgi:iron complex outermembrane receptor protein
VGTEQAANSKFDANVTYEADKWSVGLWIKNIANRAVLAATAAAGIPGPATAYLEDPRTYGVRFNVNC